MDFQVTGRVECNSIGGGLIAPISKRNLLSHGAARHHNGTLLPKESSAPIFEQPDHPTPPVAIVSDLGEWARGDGQSSISHAKPMITAQELLAIAEELSDAGGGHSRIMTRAGTWAKRLRSEG
jgi:hypothetical protein